VTGALAGLCVLLAAWLGWPGLAAGTAIAALSALLGRNPRGAVAGVLVVAAFGLAMAVRHEPRPEPAQPPWIDGADAAKGIVATAPDRSDRHQTFVLEVSDIEARDRWSAAGGRLCVVAPAQPVLRLDDRVWMGGAAAGIEDEPERFRGVLRSRGCGATWFAAAVAVDMEGHGWRRAMADGRDRFSATIRSLALGDAGALMSGLVTGDDAALSRERRTAFLDTGTTHITAVSGSNFATLVTVLAVAGAFGGMRRRWAWLVGVVAGVWGYALFVGLDAPALRAALVATAAVLAVKFGRRPDVPTLVLLAGAAMALASPGIVWGLGFQLSLASALAISACAAPPPGKGPAGWLAPALLASVAAQLATLPIVAGISGDLPVASLPANLAIAPLVAAAFPLSAIAGIAATLFRTLGEILAIPAVLAVDGTIGIVDRMAAAVGPLAIGETGGPAMAVLALASGLGCVALSVDGQRWWRQWPARRRAWRGWRLAVLGGSTLGAAAALALALALAAG